MSFKGKTYRQWANGQDIYYFENKIDPRGYYDPVLGLYTCKVCWYISQISGERLQDHWFSGLTNSSDSLIIMATFSTVCPFKEGKRL